MCLEGSHIECDSHFLLPFRSLYTALTSLKWPCMSTDHTLGFFSKLMGKIHVKNLQKANQVHDILRQSPCEAVFFPPDMEIRR